jgi:sugar phosphate isomerase/epimerase
MPPLRLAFNTNGLAHHRLDDAIDLLADLGYDGVALTPDVQHLDPLRCTPRDVEAVRAQFARTGPEWAA